MPAQPRVILVHDYLLVMRGAERTFAAICDMWPGAPIATLMYDPGLLSTRLAGHDVHASPLQRLGPSQATFRALLPLLPWAAEHLDVGGHDLVISSSSAFAHGVRPEVGAVHVCYCHSPFRYAWHERDVGLAQVPAVTRPLVSLTLSAIRRWDRRVGSAGTTHYIANSRLTQERMARDWGVDAPIVHPPVELARFAPGEPEDFVLIVCELVAHKRVDIALEAARRAGVGVKVVGGGRDEARLRALYGNDAEFVGRLNDDELAALYARARALVIPNVEEFGIIAIEAQASGRPVVAAAAGGALETILDGETGVLVEPGNVDALAAVLADEQLTRFDPAQAVANAQRFSVDAFRSKFRAQVDGVLARRSRQSGR